MLRVIEASAGLLPGPALHSCPGQVRFEAAFVFHYIYFYEIVVHRPLNEAPGKVSQNNLKTRNIKPNTGPADSGPSELYLAICNASPAKGSVPHNLV